MFSIQLNEDVNYFPRSFKLLQQEGFLARSCLLTGFEYLLKGGFQDTYKGHYYAAFFHISIGLERIMKMVAISDFMIENNFQAISDKELRKLGHDLIGLYKNTQQISNKYGEPISEFVQEPDLEFEVLRFFNSFAESNGRYFNLSNINSIKSLDPIIKWKEIIKKIGDKDFNARINKKIETVTLNNLFPGQLNDVAARGYIIVFMNFIMHLRLIILRYGMC